MQAEWRIKQTRLFFIPRRDLSWTESQRYKKRWLEHKRDGSIRCYNISLSIIQMISSIMASSSLCSGSYSFLSDAPNKAANV